MASIGVRRLERPLFGRTESTLVLIILCRNGDEHKVKVSIISSKFNAQKELDGELCLGGHCV